MNAKQNPTVTGYATKPKLTQRRWFWPAVAGVALLVGIGIGTGSDPAPEVRTETKTVTKTVPGPKETVTKEVTKEVTPAACQDALDAADHVMSVASQGFTIVSGVLDSASQLDVAGMTQGNAELKALTPKMQEARQDYDAKASACRNQ